jgi:hypothetical protein
MDFEAMLSALLGMVGDKVGVSVGGASGRPPLAAAMSGTLQAGSELRAGTPEEAFYFHFVEDPGAGFFLHAEGFAGAEELHDGDTLRAVVGDVEIIVERNPGEPKGLLGPEHWSDG